MNRLAITVLACLLACPSLLQAQAGNTLPPPGSYALSFALPDGGGAGVGIRKMLSNQRSVGLELQLGASWQEFDDAVGEDHSHSSVNLGLSPDLRLYRRQSGPVIPFIEWTTGIRYRNGANDAWAVDGRLGMGLGVEWLPLPAMSISGTTGFVVTAQHQSSRGLDSRGIMFGAVRSQLSMNLYF